MIKRVFFIFVSVILFTEVNAQTLATEADETKSSYSFSDVTVKDNLVYSVKDNKIFSGKVVIIKAAKPSYLIVEKGEISQFVMFNKDELNNDDVVKVHYKERKKHYSKSQNQNKHIEIKYLNGTLNQVKMSDPGSSTNASFDENSNVIEYEGVYDKKDFIIRFKDKTILYMKKSTQKVMKRIEAHDEKFRGNYMKMNNMFTKVSSLSPSYKSLMEKLAQPAKQSVVQKKVKITLEECQKMLGDEEFNRLKVKFSFDAALLGFCNAKANDASLSIK